MNVADDMLARELSRLPVRQANMTDVSAAAPTAVTRRYKRGWSRPIRLAKVLGLNGVGTNGAQITAGSCSLELYGIARSRFTLRPNGLVAGTGAGWRYNSLAAMWQAVSDTTSGTTILTTQAGAEIRFNLSSLPANAKSIRSVTIQMTASRNTGQALTLAAVQLVQSDGATAITEATAPTVSGQITYNHRPAITGSDDAADWVGAQLKLLTGSGSGQVNVFDVAVIVSYRVDLDVDPAVEATGERVFALNQWTVRPGDWCYVQQFFYDRSPNLVSGWEVFSSPKTVFGFAVTAPTLTGNLDSGTSRTVPVTITRYGGFTGAVSLSMSALPSGVTASFSPATVTGTSSTLTLTADNSVDTERIVAIITATSGSETHEEYGQVMVRNLTGDFSVSVIGSYAGISTVGIVQYRVLSFVVTVTSIDANFAPTNVGSLSIGGLTGFDILGVTPPAMPLVGEGSSASQTFSVRADSGKAAGTYSFEFVATNIYHSHSGFCDVTIPAPP